MYSGIQLKGNDDKLYKLLIQMGFQPEIIKVTTDPEYSCQYEDFLEEGEEGNFIKCMLCKRDIMVDEQYWYSDKPTEIPIMIILNLILILN